VSAAELARFAELVLAGGELWERLDGVSAHDAFAAETAMAALAAGYDVTPEDVSSALSTSRRQWLERWL
jgi:hypothetical protein